MTPGLRAAGRRRYVSLTTFRKNGTPVSTPVWVAPADDAVVVTTTASTGKVKRLRRDDRVELRECTRTGAVAPGAPVVRGHARIVTDEAEQQRLLTDLARKYGLQYRAVRLIERLLERPDSAPRVVLRITAP